MRGASDLRRGSDAFVFGGQEAGGVVVFAVVEGDVFPGVVGFFLELVAEDERGRSEMRKTSMR